MSVPQVFLSHHQIKIQICIIIIIGIATLALVVHSVSVAHHRNKETIKTIIPTTTTNNYNKLNDKTVVQLETVSSSFCKPVDQHGISCSSISINGVCQEIDKWTDSNIKFNQLELNTIQFQDGKIDKNWLQCKIASVLTQLTIRTSMINSIEESSFSNKAFPNLQTMILDRTTLSSFRQNIFIGLNLNRLEITCNAPSSYEDNVFAEISQMLEILLLQSCIQQLVDENVLTKLTGPQSLLRNLKTLDLRYNDLRIIKNNSFSGTPSLQTLFLSRSNIEAIEAGSFSVHYLKMLDLSQNKLKTLPNGIFGNVESGITISGNQWICDCDLLWLKQMFDNPSSSHKFTENDNFLCTTDSGDVNYDSVIFCNETTTSTSTTTTTTITTTTEPPPRNVIYNCNKPIQHTMDFENCIGSISVREQSVTFNISENNGAYFLSIVGDVKEEDDIIWFDFNKYSQTGCVKAIQPDLIYALPKLDVNISYIFCLLHANQNMVSPFDCGALKLNPKSNVTTDDDIWISKDNMIPIICGLCGTYLLALLLGGFIAFYFVRKHPSLLKGNKRVIVVQNDTADAIVMPANYYERARYPESLRSCGSGYLTPKHVVYKCSHLKTISESVRSYKNGRTKRDEPFYEPPPLPPNHPKPHRQSSSV